jgi:hypothetical protein
MSSVASGVIPQLVCLAAIVGAVGYIFSKPTETKEGLYIGPQAVYMKDQHVLQAAPAPFAMGTDKASFLQSNINFKSVAQGIPALPPRTFGDGYQKQLQGPQAPYHVMGTPYHSLGDDYATMIQQSNAYGDASMKGLDQETTDQVLQSRYRGGLEYTEAADLFPTDDMGGTAYGKIISDPQTFVNDRFIVANMRRRNLDGANFIFGDVPIPPNATGWFQVSVLPHLDLRAGVVHNAMSNLVDTEDDGEGTITMQSSSADYALRFQRMP